MVEIVYKKYRFADLKEGDTFIDSDGDLMIKVKSLAISHYNCVMLSSGILYSYDDNDCVIPVCCRIEVCE